LLTAGVPALLVCKAGLRSATCVKTRGLPPWLKGRHLDWRAADRSNRGYEHRSNRGPATIAGLFKLCQSQSVGHLLVLDERADLLRRAAAGSRKGNRSEFNAGRRPTWRRPSSPEGQLFDWRHRRLMRAGCDDAHGLGGRPAVPGQGVSCMLMAFMVRPV